MEPLPEQIDGYRILEPLGEGGMGAVYKVESPVLQGPVALKWLGPGVTKTSLDRLRFEREFNLASKCDHPYLVKAYHYGVYQERPYYTMELVRGRPLGAALNPEGRPFTPDRLPLTAEVVTKLLEGLDYIHQRSIIHRDLKPENVLVEEGGDPRILDFGLARVQSLVGELAAYTRQKLTLPGTVVGTVHYMSPEQLTEQDLDARADLFALGVILYELLCGELPFTGPPVEVLTGIINRAPRPPSQLAPDLPSELEELVLRLLAKHPADRFSSAGETLDQWLSATSGRRLSVAGRRRVEGPEDLYAPRLVGRRRQLQAFIDSLGRFAQGGSGLLWVTGSGGVGKTRFLEECGVQARTRGFHPIWGRAFEMESLPYQVWIPALRWAVSEAWGPELEPFRKILSPLLPELETTTERTPHSFEKAQLFEGMSRLLQAAGRRGALIYLEDLHWCEPASLEFLQFLTRSLEPTSLLLVATYREGELELFGALKETVETLAPASEQLRLEPLEEAETREMAGSMLGRELHPSSGAEIYRQTGGNPLFVEEVVKAALIDGSLQEQEGVWRFSTVRGSVPATVRDVLTPLLEAVGPQEMDILRCASILGYEFEFTVLAEISKVPELELLDRLLRLVERGVLAEASDHDFRFRSRVLLELVEETVSHSDRRRLHLAAARALTTMGSHQVRELAHHFEQAGEATEAAGHLLKAAAQAANAFAYGSALELYRRAQALPQAATAGSRVDEKIADVLYQMGQSSEAQAAYLALLSRSNEKLEQARLYQKLGDCWQRSGDYRQAYTSLSTALKLLGVETGRQLVDSLGLWPQWLLLKFAQGSSQSSVEVCRQLHRTLQRQLSVLFFLRKEGWVQESFHLARLQQQVARKLESDEVEAQAEFFLAFAAMQTGTDPTPHLDKAAMLTRGLKVSPYKALCLRNVGFVYLLSGHEEQAEEYCLECLELCQKLGDRHGLAQAHMVLCALNLHLASFEEALEHARKILDQTGENDLPTFRSAAHSYLARASAQMGLPEEAEEHLAEACRIGDPLELPYLDLLLHVARVWTYCDTGRYRECLDSAREGLRFCDRLKALPYYRLTIQCAGVWAMVAWKKLGGLPRELEKKLPARLKRFRQDAKGGGFRQFILVGRDLAEGTIDPERAFKHGRQLRLGHQGT